VDQNELTETRMKEHERTLYVHGRMLQAAEGIDTRLTDMNGRFVEFNRAFAAICDYPEDELRRLDYWQLTPEAYAESEKAQLAALERWGRYGPYEKNYRRRDGSLVPVNLNGMLVTGADGQRYIWSIVEDITPRKKSEQM
jgi:PAS domain S-box-containing protein